MAEDYDRETGEVIEPDDPLPVNMPASIAKAIIGVMGDSRQIGYDDYNKHSSYNFTSIDKFLAFVRPLCAAHGLIILMNENDCAIRRQASERGESSWLAMTYHVMLYGADGEVFGPIVRRSVVPAVGAQAFGSAESYVLKRFMRNLFLIPTGEKNDADKEEGKPLPPSGKPAGELKGGKAPHDPAQGSSGQAGSASGQNGAAGAKSPGGVTRDDALIMYNHLRQGIVEAPHQSALDSLIAQYTRDGRLEAIKYWGEKAYASCMESVSKRTDQFRNAEKGGSDFPGDRKDEIPA